MYLKKLEISGFKSFANTTTLQFIPPRQGAFSVTAIVGPNGSGKSNIADAIRWVLGEQSLKQLRGKKSEDVIFGGSEGRGKLSLASVSMVLDNHDHRAAIDYEELVITRRLYRNGESEYLINGNQVRLLDLQLLLAQTQFGHGSYGVIGQGMIDRLLLQTPAERKYFFDEAVGIKEFQIKRHQSYLKLTRTQENIVQAQRLLQEVEPHLKTLRRQVKKLTERQNVEAELRNLQNQYYGSLYRLLTQEIDQHQTMVTGLNHDARDKESLLTNTQIELAELAKSASREDQFRMLETEYQSISKEKNDAEREESILSGRLQTEYGNVGKQNIAWLEQKIIDLSRDEKTLIEEEQQSHNEANEAVMLRQLKQSEVQHYERRHLALTNERSRVEKLWFEAREANHDMSLSGLKSAEAILSRRNEFGGAVYGLVAQLGTVEERLRLALEVAAGSHLSSIVVLDDTVAERCITFLKNNQLGVATFLPKNKIRPRALPGDLSTYLQKPGVFGLAFDLVKYKEEFSAIFSYVFGSTLVVDSIATARSIGIGRVRMVTLDGDILETSGSMKGGFRRSNSSSLHFVGNKELALHSSDVYQADLDRLRSELTETERLLQAARLAQVTAEVTERTATQKVQLISERHRVLARELSSLEQERSMTQLAPEDFTAMMNTLTKERTLIATTLTKINNRLEMVRKKMSAFNEAEEAKRQRVFALQDTMQNLQTALNEVTIRRNAEQMELVKLETRREDLVAEAYTELKVAPTVWQTNQSEFLERHQCDVIKEEIEKLKYRLSLIGGIDEEVMKEYEETQSKYDSLSTELTDLTKAADDITELIAELDTLMKKKHTAAFANIKKEFSRYFSILFEGGKAELVEVFGEEGEDSQEESLGEDKEFIMKENEQQEKSVSPVHRKILTGIDVVASPPGKKIKHIAALSGGERTLTSIALVSAILHTNPPPFVFLDEVEAALDEANTVRFNTILRELAVQSQFIVITHNRATMHAADVLYGVTMGADGVSKLLSVTLEHAKNEPILASA